MKCVVHTKAIKNVNWRWEVLIFNLQDGKVLENNAEQIIQDKWDAY